MGGTPPTQLGQQGPGLQGGGQGTQEMGKGLVTPTAAASEGGGTLSYIVGNPCGGTPASNIAVVGGTREEGEEPPLKERRDMVQWLTPLEAAEEATAEARAGNAGVREGRKSCQ